MPSSSFDRAMVSGSRPSTGGGFSMHGRPVVLHGGLRSARDRRHGRRAADPAGRQLLVWRLHNRADRAAGRPTGGARPDRRCRRVPRLRWIRRGRHGGQAGPPLLGRHGSAGEAGHRVARARVPRDARVGDGAVGHPREQGRVLRRDHRGSRPRRRRRHRKPRGPVRTTRVGDRRLHRRAGHRRRWGHPAGAVVLGRGGTPVPRARRPAHRR